MRSSAELFKALADETRLRILNLLVRGELCVCDIMSVLDIGQSKASRHLACLRNVGLVNDRRNGVWMHYSLARPSGVTHHRVLEWLAEAATELPQAAADLKALRAVQRQARRYGKCASGDGERKPMPSLRSSIHLPLAVLLVAGLFAQPPRAAGQSKSPPAPPVPAVQRQAPTSAPASQAVKPGQPQVPQPTVVLKPGEVPGIAFREPTYDFGRVRAGTDVTHDFEFTNTGNGPLEILSVKPG